MMSFHISKLPVVPICVIGIHPRDQETSAARRQSSQRTNQGPARQAGGWSLRGEGGDYTEGAEFKFIAKHLDFVEQ